MPENLSVLNGLTGAGLFSWTCFHVLVVEKSGIEQDKTRPNVRQTHPRHNHGKRDEKVGQATRARS